MAETAAEHGTLDAIAFVGQTLGPLFSEDPKLGGAAELYDALASTDVDAAAAEWPFVDESIARSALADIQRGLVDRHALVLEYRRLFVGPAHKVCPPWGSVYTDRDGVMFGVTALCLHDWLSAHEVIVTVGDSMPDDHIGRMLSLMAWIARNRPDILGEYLAGHLLTWAPHFLALLGERTELDFFRGLARLTDSSLVGIRETLGLEVETPRFYR